MKVEAPPSPPKQTKDLEALIEEARRRALRRRVRYAAAVVVAALVGAAVYLALSSGKTGTRTKAAPTPELAACRSGDYRLSIGGQPSTQMLVGAVRVMHRRSAPCRFDRVVRVAVLDKHGALVPHSLRNPAEWRLTGKLSRAHVVQATWTWGLWCGGRPFTFTARVGHGPVARFAATPPSFACDVRVSRRLTRFRQ